jgi:hypothetical protein
VTSEEPNKADLFEAVNGNGRAAARYLGRLTQ